MALQGLCSGLEYREIFNNILSNHIWWCNASFISSNQTLLCVVFPTFCLADDWLSIKLFWQPGAEPTSQAWIDKTEREMPNCWCSIGTFLGDHQRLSCFLTCLLSAICIKNLGYFIYYKHSGFLQARNVDNQPDPLLYYKMIILRHHEIFSGWQHQQPCRDTLVLSAWKNLMIS